MAPCDQAGCSSSQSLRNSASRMEEMQRASEFLNRAACAVPEQTRHRILVCPAPGPSFFSALFGLCTMLGSRAPGAPITLPPTKNSCLGPRRLQASLTRRQAGRVACPPFNWSLQVFCLPLNRGLHRPLQAGVRHGGQHKQPPAAERKRAPPALQPCPHPAPRAAAEGRGRRPLRWPLGRRRLPRAALHCSVQPARPGRHGGGALRGAALLV